MIYDVVRKALEHSLGIDEAIIRPDALIKHDLELDSTETVVIALEIKRHFGMDFKFPAHDISLKAICEQVEHLLAETV